MSEHPADADADPTDGRHESLTQRLDRNWTEVLQELRVLQTGTQLLTGFLLTVAFQPVFLKLGALEKTVYVVVVLLAAVSTVLALAPVALHRALFRMRARDTLVRVADRCLRVSLGVVGLALTGVVLLVVDQAAGRPAGIAACAGALVLVLALWVALPVRLRVQRRRLPSTGREV